MKKIIIIFFVLAISSTSFSVPLGGKGSDRKESIKGSLEVSGTLSVNGKTILNGNEYIWPSTKGKIPSGYVLKTENNGMLVWDKEVSPSGNEGAIQFNSNGIFASDNNLFWDNSQKRLFIGSSEVSLNGHKHQPSDINGIIPIELGGTGSNDGSITAKNDLTLSSGSNGSIILNSTNGNIYLNGIQTISKAIIRSDAGFSTNGENGITDSFIVVSDVKLENNTLKKKFRQISISGGIITKISPESDWIDSGFLTNQ